MSGSEAKRNPVEELAEEFLDRYRSGDRPALSDYVRRHPELAAEIREVFPALVMLEEAGPKPGPEQAARLAGGAGPCCERLGDYRILREVGRGGMGIVYEAEQESLGRHVALKVLPEQAAASPHHLQRFKREARSAARLHHTNIVPVYDVGDFQGVHYYAMQFIQGQGLDEVLSGLRRLRGTTRNEGEGTPTEDQAPPKAGGSTDLNLTAVLARGLRTDAFVTGEAAPSGEGPPPGSSDGERRTGDDVPASPGEEPRSENTPGGPSSGGLSDLSAQSDYHFYRSVARVGLQVAEALAYAHGQKVLHRDIKPANLLLDLQGTVWVTDFGLAKEEGDDLTRTGDLVGTLRFMAPERFKGVSDARSDVYSLGLTLYELLTLRPAFEENDRGQLIRRVTNEEPPRPRKLDPRLPRDLETIILKATSKEPVLRYQTAAELAEDLRRFVADRPIRARRSAAWEHAWRWCRRNPALGGALLIAVAGVLATAAVSVWFALYQADANAELRRRQNAMEAALFESRLGAARLAEERGLGLLRQGETNPGLVWLAHALEMAPEEAADFRADVCRQLAWWHGRATPLRQVLAHPGEVTAVAFSPDGRSVFTGCADGKVRRWDARSGKLLGEPAALTGAVDRLVGSADGKTLCVLNKQEGRFLDAASGQPLPVPRGAFPPRELLTDPLVRCSADGKTVIRLNALHGINSYFAMGTLTEEVAPGKKRTLGIGLATYYPAVTLSPDGKLFLAISDVRSAATGAAVGKPLRDSLLPTVAAFRPDGKALVTGNTHYVVRAWDVQSGEGLCQPLPHPGRVTALAFSPDGRLALTACADGGARLWDLAPPDPDFQDVELPELKRDKGPAPQLTFHDGRFIAVDSAKKVYGHDGVRTKYRWTLPLTGRLDRVAVARGGEVLATASRDEGNVWGRPARVRFWDGSRGGQIGPTVVHPDYVCELAVSPDGETLATTCADGNVRFWKVGTDAPAGATLSHPKGQWSKVAFGPDGRVVVTGCGDGTVRLWDRGTGELLHKFSHPSGVAALAVDPGGRRLLVGGGGTARLWDLATKKPVGQSLMHPTDVSAVAFSPDGQVALTGTSGAVQLWEPSTALPLGPPLPCPRGAWALAFAPDRDAILVSYSLGYRLFPVKPPVPDDVRRLALSVQVLTGLELDEGGAVQILHPAAWNDRQRQLEGAGGSLLP